MFFGCFTFISPSEQFDCSLVVWPFRFISWQVFILAVLSITNHLILIWEILNIFVQVVPFCHIQQCDIYYITLFKYIYYLQYPYDTDILLMFVWIHCTCTQKIFMTIKILVRCLYQRCGCNQKTGSRPI